MNERSAARGLRGGRNTAMLGKSGAVRFKAFQGLTPRLWATEKMSPALTVNPAGPPTIRPKHG